MRCSVHEIGINPTGKACSGQAAKQPDPPNRDYNGNHEEAKIKVVAGDRSFYFGTFNCGGRSDQHDGDRGHIGLGAFVFVRS
jgi:hypothetical protein